MFAFGPPLPHPKEKRQTTRTITDIAEDFPMHIGSRQVPIRYAVADDVRILPMHLLVVNTAAIGGSWRDLFNQLERDYRE